MVPHIFAVDDYLWDHTTESGPNKKKTYSLV